MQPQVQKLLSKIYLTGFMGSGKSTVGPLVAQRLGWRFLDLDDVIVEQAGQPIPAIFEEGGEAEFRRRETDALREVAKMSSGAVVATGGGTLTQAENMERARNSGFVVYLQAPVDVLAGRLRGTAAERPLLQGEGGNALTGPALIQHIESLLAERRPCYEQAHGTVPTAANTPAETAAEVVRMLHTEHAREHASGEPSGSS